MNLKKSTTFREVRTHFINFFRRKEVQKYPENAPKDFGQSEVQLVVLTDVLRVLPVKAMILVIMKYIKIY